MSKGKSLIKNTIYILLGKVCTQFISFILLPVYTAYLTTDDYGIVDLIITYVQLLVPIVTLQLEMAIFRFLIDKRGNNDEISKVISNALLTISVITLIFATIYIPVSIYLNIKYNVYILLCIVASIFSGFFLQLSRGLGDNITYSISSTISGITTVILNIILIVILRYGAQGMLVSMIGANILGGAYVLFKLNVYKYIKLNKAEKKEIKKMLSYSIPLIPNGLSWWIVNVSDRTLISFFINLSANGIYAISNKFSSLLTGVFNIFGLSWTESASIHINDDDRDSFFSRTMNISFKMFSSVCMMIIAIMPLIFSILVNKQYDEAYMYIPILILGTICSSVVTLYSAIYVAKKMTKKVAMTSILSAIINIVINITFIKFIGIYAAAISTMLAYFCMVVYRHFDLKKYVNIKWNYKYIISFLIVISIVITIYYHRNILLSFIGIVIAGVFVIWSNRSEINETIHQIRGKVSRIIQK